MRENKYQAELRRRLEDRFPGCFILKNDSGLVQGIPDLTILYKDRWAILEVKASRPTSEDDFEPNQEWYLELFHSMSYAACIYPENEEAVLDELQHTFTARRSARVPKS